RAADLGGGDAALPVGANEIRPPDRGRTLLSRIAVLAVVSLALTLRALCGQFRFLPAFEADYRRQYFLVTAVGYGPGGHGPLDRIMEQALQRVGSWRWWLVGFGLALAVLGPVRAQPSDTVGVYLTWQADPATTMTVNWVDLYEEGPTNVWYRVRGDSEWLRATGARHQVHPS